MTKLQQPFLDTFRERFSNRFGIDSKWQGGQNHENVARFIEPIANLRHGGLPKPGEAFELGDLNTTINGRLLIVEFDSAGVAIQNLVKFWPYLRGYLNRSTQNPIVLCHFSNWGSWGSYRDLWEWMLKEIQHDLNCAYPLSARQFDHGGINTVLRDQSIAQSLEWLDVELDIHH
jgi:hypothetical protein